METVFASFFGCNSISYIGKPGCTEGVYKDLSYPVIEEDYLKDGCRCNKNDTPPAVDTNWIICGNKTMIFTRSMLNGALVCLENANTTHETNRQYLSDYIRGDTLSNRTFSNMTWNLAPQWYNHDGYMWH